MYFLNEKLKSPDENGHIDWTFGKVPIFDYETLFLPTNHANVHWFLIMILMGEKIIRCYDPLKGRAVARYHYLELALNWICAHKQKLHPNNEEGFDYTEYRKSWKFEFVDENCPFQTNGSL